MLTPTNFRIWTTMLSNVVVGRNEGTEVYNDTTISSNTTKVPCLKQLMLKSTLLLKHLSNSLTRM